MAANLLEFVHFYCCSHSSRGSAFVPCLIEKLLTGMFRIKSNKIRGVVRGFNMLKTIKNEVLRYLTVLLYFSDMIVNNKGADQTVWMRRLVCAFVVLCDHSHQGECDVKAQASWLLSCYVPLSWNKYIIFYALVCLADGTFERPSQSGGGTCPLVLLK